MPTRGRERRVAGIALVGVQVIHAAVPAETDAEGYLGAILGVLALLASIAALVGVVRDREWGRKLLGVTGAAVAVGFLLYHALPIRSGFTNPYIGEPAIGVLQWTPVIGAIVIGVWCIVAARPRSQRRRSLT
jgi:hypothetical protein